MKKIFLRSYDVIVGPVVTEKAVGALAPNQYAFDVCSGATKPEIKEAFESIFEVKVENVNTLVRKGKKKIFRGRIGKRSGLKRAYITLHPDSKLELTEWSGE